MAAPLESEVKTFLKTVANTVLKLDILSYYHDHPFAMDNAEGLARWLNRRTADVVAGLEELTRHGLFSHESEGGSAVYAFQPDEKTAALVERVIASYRLTREAVYTEVLALQEKQDELRREYQRILFTERGRTETILNSLEESVLVLNRTGTVLLANGQFYERFAQAGIAEREGPGLEELAASGEIAGAVRSSIAKIGEESLEETELGHGERFYRLQSTPVTGPDGKVIQGEEGGPAATVTVFRDITREREIERMREDFISMLTHDLRNPLGIIFGSSTLVLDGKLGLLNEKQHKLLSNVVKSCGLMDRLIEDFLTLSKLEAGQLPLSREKVDLNSLLQGVLQMFQPQIAELGLEAGFTTECEEVRVSADLIQLERVVSNLVSNAIKYNREGGRIDVRSFREGNWVKVAVDDTGKGISAEELPYVFEKFRRAAAVEHVKGTGLGLTIAKQLIGAMGGQIKVESEEGRGSRFTFSLPAL
ncbi:MAG: hypothetical protein A3F83_13140 [Candidatus Glassbacteria bacterium RIFCSPLOWO2_12_FULL_58_11]|uniref:histidine kinase n=1 Tax=Candidatus Glassbacteria bacterium RIFCSPLOWO2_12_FULL_58_11 TaxID=1817867 RepID=A0A1F5YWB9_9BACT|nr:MAG: hypothetical protein A3F83_13140 [Candidatus Glassbacteria bacterium RIFCSPLOWO2_12_FULL_58_11]